MIFEEKPVIIAGPCAVESREQIMRIAGQLSEHKIKYLRGGAFKPRTSPDSFQGLGLEGLRYMREAADNFEMKVVSEILDSASIDAAYDFIDIIQIGSRNMASYGLIKEIGKKTARDGKPVMLKRGFNATITEYLLAAEYIIRAGNENVILCLRGIRTFEQIDSMLRFTPDLSAIIELKRNTKFTVIFDPSHSTGNREYVPDIAKAALFMGADGLLIETHDKPEEALSDEDQAIHPGALKEIIDFIKK